VTEPKPGSGLIPGSDPGSSGEGEAAGPQLELDQLLTQLIERAEDVRGAHHGLRELIRATNMITGDLDLTTVLRRIAEAACQLARARYGALGVIAPGGGLEQFIHVGMDDDAVTRIGHLPEGKGLLGALIEAPQPIRLRHLDEDPRSVGFPEGHPAMDSFLGVPIRVRDVVFGNLYLTGRLDRDEFTEQDQELVTSLAATAAVAIENARLFEQARRRQQWLAASTDITQQLLSTQGEEPLHLIARRTQEVADADAVTVVLPVGDTGRFIVEVATGDSADQLTAMSYPQEGTLSAHVLETGEPALVEDMSPSQLYAVHMSELMAIGALMALPLSGAHGRRGVLLVARLRGRPRFTEAELGMATTFANHAAIALELTDARARQQRVVLLEDRDRIARDLHDHVIQRLFALGLSVESVATALDGPPADRLGRVVTELDETIRQIRTTIFQLRGSISPGDGVRSAVLALLPELTGSLGFQPEVSFRGPVDLIVDADTTDEIRAVIREGLTNVARHAAARRARVVVTAESQRLTVEISDDGRGLGETTRRSGLDNLRRRAEARGGRFDITSPWPEPSEQPAAPPPGGTQLLWTIPLS